MIVTINNKDYDLKVPVTFEEKRIGLSSIDNLSDTDGMLFIMESGDEANNIIMNTAEMLVPIVMLFVGADKVIKEVFEAGIGINEISRKNIAYVVELSEGEALDSEGESIYFDDVPKEAEVVTQGNILIDSIDSPMNSIKKKLKLGGTIDIKEENVDIIKDAMQVLDDKGNVVMNIFGGERIFSIKHTKEIISLAGKVQEGKESPKKLGKLIQGIIEIHDTQEQQYTE